MSADQSSATYGSISKLTAGDAIIVNSLIVEGSTDYINTTVDTIKDLQLQMGLSESRRLVSETNGSPATFTIDGSLDGTVSVISNGAYAILSDVSEFTTGTLLGYRPVLQVVSSTLSNGNYTITLNKHDGGSISAVNQLSDVNIPAGTDFSANIYTFSQISNGSVYGMPGLSFNTYATQAGTVVANTTRCMYFGTNSLNVYKSNQDVIDLNLIGGTRSGIADTPYYKVNGYSLLNPNNLIVDTTFQSNSAIYLNANSSTQNTQGTWRIKVLPNNRLAFQVLKSTGSWTNAFSLTPP